jgi:diaminobutyrate-2-oxoglutarate transaminase
MRNNFLESNVRSYCRSFPKTFNKAKNHIIYDENDNVYIDFLSGAGSLNYGHNNEIIKNAILQYLNNDGIVLGLDLDTSAKKTFIQAFNKFILLPRSLNFKLQFTGPTGTSVVESAVKLARKFTNRQNSILLPI